MLLLNRPGGARHLPDDASERNKTYQKNGPGNSRSFLRYDSMNHPFLSMKLAICLLLLMLGAQCVRSAPVELLPPEFRGAVQPQVAVSPDGRIHVVFGKENTLYHVASADGHTFSPPVKVGELDKLALRMRRGPRIAATDRCVVVTAISHADGNLHAWTSMDGGKSWRPGAKVNDTEGSAREGLHAMAGSAGGFVLATWLDSRKGATELWSATSDNGGVDWGANKLVYRSPDGHICECCQPSAAVGAGGEIALMWRNWLGGSRDLYLSTSNDRGKTFSAAVKLGTGAWKLDGCPMDGGSVALSGGGKPVAIWRREKAIFASEAPTEERLIQASSVQPVVVMSKAGPVYFWEHEGGLMIQKGREAPARFAEKGTAAAAAALPGGGETVVWESTGGNAPTILADVLR